MPSTAIRLAQRSTPRSRSMSVHRIRWLRCPPAIEHRSGQGSGGPDLGPGWPGSPSLLSLLLLIVVILGRQIVGDIVEGALTP